MDDVGERGETFDEDRPLVLLGGRGWIYSVVRGVDLSAGVRHEPKVGDAVRNVWAHPGAPYSARRPESASRASRKVLVVLTAPSRFAISAETLLRNSGLQLGSGAFGEFESCPSARVLVLLSGFAVSVARTLPEITEDDVEGRLERHQQPSLAPRRVLAGDPWRMSGRALSGFVVL